MEKLQTKWRKKEKENEGEGGKAFLQLVTKIIRNKRCSAIVSPEENEESPRATMQKNFRPVFLCSSFYLVVTVFCKRSRERR